MTEPRAPRPRKSEMDLIRAVWEEARDLIKRLEGSTVQRFSVQAGETKIEIERRAGVAVGGSASSQAAAAAAPVEEVAVADGRHPIVAPLVGNFYRAPQPRGKPF